MSSNRRPPFVPNPDPSTIVVPGVDSNAPAAIQLEQIEQLITLRLASIDNNLARSHQIITSQVLPAVQRFARASQPTRDAARFWKSFFEAAAQVHVPIGADYSVTETDIETDEGQVSRSQEGQELADTTITDPSMASRGQDQTRFQQNAIYGQNIPTGQPNSQTTAQISTEHSFAGVFASTPARTRHGDMTQDSITSSDASWTPSHGAMLNVLNQQLRTGFRLDEPSQPPKFVHRPVVGSQGPILSDVSSTATESSIFQPPTPSQSGSEQSLNLLSDFPAHHLPPKGTHDKGKSKTGTTNLRQNVLRKGTSGTPKLAKYNPFLPKDTQSENGKPIDPLTWNGLVDLSSSSIASTSSASSLLPDFMPLPSDSSSASATNSPDRGASNRDNPSIFSVPSPSPVLIRFPQAEKNVVGTPSKQAADLLVADMLAGMDMSDSPNVSVPTPPSLNRYRSMGHGRAEAEVTQRTGGASLFTGPTRPTRTVQQQQYQQEEAFATTYPLLKDEDDEAFGGNIDDSFASEDGYGEQSYGPQPTGFSAANPDDSGLGAEGDSFDSEDSYRGGGSYGGERMDAAGGQEDEDTLFGPRGNPPPTNRAFHLDGQGMRTWMGGRLEDAVPAQGSPTPFAGEFVPLDRRQQQGQR